MDKMGKSRNELRKASKAKTREALANTDPDNVELQQRAERYHTAQKAKREALEAEYPGLTRLEIDHQKALQKALQKEAKARIAVDNVQSQLRNREQRLKQAKDAGVCHLSLSSYQKGFTNEFRRNVGQSQTALPSSRASSALLWST